MKNPAPAGPAGAQPRIVLRLLATTDVHMHLLPYDYAAGLPSATNGLARTATLIHAARAEVRNTLLFDNGDFLHGNAVGDAITADIEAGRMKPLGPHPMIAAMRTLGVDAITLGNHDFDHGVGFLGHVLRAAPFPVVVSNMSLHTPDGATSPRPAASVEPFTLLERDLVDEAGGRHRLRIGVLGFLPPDSITGLRGTPFTPEFRDIVDTARTMVPQLRALGADLVVVLAHSGIGTAEHRPAMENALLPLAQVPGIDAIIGGHAHQVFPDPTRAWPAEADPTRGMLYDTPVVIPGFWGSHLGVIDLALSPDSTGKWRVASHRVEARPVAAMPARCDAPAAEVAPDPQLVALVNRLHNKLIELSREQVGDTRKRLHSYFAAAAPSPALDVVHRAQARWARKALAGTGFETLPVLPSTAPFKAGGLPGASYFADIRPGRISRAELADLYPFPNHPCAIRLTGAELADWLERAASVFNRIVPGGGDQPLMSSGTPIYNFESVAGCSYEIDLTAPARYTPDGTLHDPAAHRIRALRIGDRPIGVDDSVILLTNSFRLGGGGNYPLPEAPEIVLDDPTGLRDIVAEYLAACSPVGTEPWANWRFAPIDGAAALFPSSPDAANLARLSSRRIVPAQRQADGFQLYRLALEGPVSYMARREVGAGKHLANPVRSGRKQP